MQLLGSSLVTSLANLVVFSALPVLWWWVRHRKEVGFSHWVGLYRPQLQSSIWVLVAFAVVYGFFYNFDFTCLASPETLAYLESSAQVSANVYAGMGVAAIPAALIENFIANGLAEEILFRGGVVQAAVRSIWQYSGNPDAGGAVWDNAQPALSGSRAASRAMVSSSGLWLYWDGGVAAGLAGSADL